jgi:hypothetical protein
MLYSSTVRLIVCLGGLLAAVAVSAQEPGADADRIAAAKELMEVTGVTKQMDGMVQAMGEGFRKGARDAADGAAADKLGDEFDRHMQRLMSYRQAMLDEFAVLYAKRFSAEELRAVAGFYRSPTGQKFVEAMPALMQDGAQIGMKYSQKALQAPAEGTK